jgi:23S rRNA pseudouridine1911/1915/1917 synthase
VSVEDKKLGHDTLEDRDEDAFYEHQTIIADPKQSALRIDKFLLDRIERISRNKIQQAIRVGAIQVNGGHIKPNYKIRPGDKISLILPKPALDEIGLAPEEIPLSIIYEDEDLMVINKQAGLVVHPGVGNWTGTMVNGLIYYLQHTALPLMEGNPIDRPGIVHRIDKNTSGLLVVAKNDYAMTHLAKQFFNHTIERKYLALVWGQPENESGTITGHVGRHPRHRFQMTVFKEGEAGKHAVTHYKVKEGMYYVSLVECWLETGRTHQIRVHMKHLGHPLFNDERYGGDQIVKGTVFQKYRQFVTNCFKLFPRHALHATSLGFMHPRTNENIQFSIDPPEDFYQVLEKWRKYVSTRAK